MPPPPDTPANPVPLCVDLDGTLIKTDLLWESLARLLRRNPFQLLPVLFWWMRGRAFLKQQLARRVKIDPAALPYHEPFLAYLREQKAAGRKLILVTASDRDMALPVANHVGLFDEVLGSDGKTNLRGANKLKVLIAKFGERGFDYAGNSSADLAIWRGAREAIVVNASTAVLKRAAECTRPGPTFTQDYSPFATLKRFLNELLVRSGYLLAIGAGLLLTAAFPKIGIAGCAWIAPALMMAAAHGKRGGDAFRVGYVAGLTHFLSSLYWLLLIPVTGYPILGWFLLGVYLGLYPAVWVWLVNWWGESPSGRRRTKTDPRKPKQISWSGRTSWSLMGAAIWVALEMVRVRLFSGFPWNPLGASQYQLIPLIQIASVTGVYGVSFLVVWVSLSLFSAVCMIFHRPASRFAWQIEILLPLAAIAVLFAFGLARMNGQNPPGPTLRITLVQPSIPQTLIWDPNTDTNRFRQLLELSEQALTSAQQTNEPLAPSLLGAPASRRLFFYPQLSTNNPQPFQLFHHVLAQFDVPIGQVNEMLPTVMPVQAEIDLHKRTPFRALGLADEVHAGFLRLAVGFLRVAFDAGTNNVLPGRRPAAVPRDHVVQVQILPVKHPPAILAGVLVALKNVVARELHFLLGQPVIDEQQNDSRHADAEGNGADGFLLRRIFGNVAPFLKIEGVE